MRFLLIFILIHSSKLMAQHYDPGVTTILDQIESLTKPQNSCQEARKIDLLYPRSNIGKDLQNCAFALCGASRENPTALITDVNFTKYAPPQALARIQKLEPIIKNVIEKGRAANIDGLVVLKNALVDNKIDEINFSNLEDYTRKELFPKIFDQIVQLSILPKNSIKDRIQISYEFPAWADENFKQVAREYAESFKFAHETRYDLFKSKKIYTDEEIRNIYLEKMKLAEETIAKNPNLEHIDFKIKSLAEIKEKVSKNLPLNNSDFSAVEIIINDQSPVKTPAMVIACTTDNCAKALKNYFKNEVANIKIDDLITEFSDNEQFNREVNRCKAGLLANSIKAGNLKTANLQFNEAMKAIEKNVLPIFSTHSRGILKKSLAQLKINVSKPSDMWATSEAEFLNDTKSYLKNKGSTPSLNNPDRLLKKLYDVSEGHVSEEINPCMKIFNASVWDATDPEKKILYVSDYSCSHDMRGKQIIAHEIGHNINYLFSKLNISKESLKTYMDLRQCITGNYPKIAKTKYSFFSTDTIFTEEDMADYISNLAFSDNQDLFSCALLYPDIKTNGYVNPKLRPENHIDPHSEGLLRVLMESIYKGKTTPISCRKAMEEASSRLEFNKCGK